MSICAVFMLLISYQAVIPFVIPDEPVTVLFTTGALDTFSAAILILSTQFDSFTSLIPAITLSTFTITVLASMQIGFPVVHEWYWLTVSLVIVAYYLFRLHHVICLFIQESVNDMPLPPPPPLPEIYELDELD